MIDNADKVQCTITGFKGIVIARTEYINGCWRFLVQAQKLEAGKTVEEWFDLEQLKVLTKAKVKRVLKKKKDRPGGSHAVHVFNNP